MATKVIMPKLSPTMEEGQISRWLKKEGDKVSMGEPLAEIDTDKATMEMQALGNGVLRKILINEGQSAPLGQTIAIVGEPDEDIASLLSEAPAAKPQQQEQKKQEAPPPAPEPPQPQPQAKAAAAENGRQPQPAASDSGRMIVSPLAARMATEAGIDLRSLQGSGPGGRIIKRDIEAAISKPKAAPAPVVFPQAGASGYRDEAASQIRQTIAKRLVTSLGPVPHFFLTTDIEMDRAAEMRKGINALDPDLKISINDIIIKVTAAALIQHPQVNASYQDKFVRYYEQADVGVAVAIEDGLITVVATHLEGQSNYRTIEELQSNLDPDLFWRVHRSYLVNINRIREVVPWFKSSYQLRMDDKKQTEIPVSRVQTKRLRMLLKL